MSVPGHGRQAFTALIAAYASFGAFWGVWVVVFADFLHERQLSAGGVSVHLSAMSIVAIGLMTFLSPRLEHLPRRRTVAVSLLVHAMGIIGLVVASDALLFSAFIMMGVGTGLIDVFVNAAAQELEESRDSAVLQWVHAAYGAGAGLAALATAGALSTGLPYGHTVIVAGVGQLWAAAFVYCAVDAAHGHHRPRGRVSLAVFARRPAMVAPALVVMFAFFIEGSMDVWSVIFLNETLGSTVMAAASAFAAFAFATSLGRAFAARVLYELGHRKTMLLSAVGSLLAAAMTVMSTDLVVVGLAFLLLGFSLSAAAPAAFGMAGDAGVGAGLAVGAMTTIGYTGFVIGPPIMGWLADNAGLRVAMGAIVVSAIGMVLASVSMLFHIPGRAEGQE